MFIPMWIIIAVLFFIAPELVFLAGIIWLIFWLLKLLLVALGAGVMIMLDMPEVALICVILAIVIFVVRKLKKKN